MNEITIYKIYCKDESIKDIYIGSTSNFKKRKGEHKSCCNNINGKEYNYYKYVFIRENKGWDNWIMESITTCSKEKQYTIERWYIENVEHTNLNKSIPTKTKQEWRLDNKQKIIEQSKQYYNINKEKIIKQTRQYYKNNKEKNDEQMKKYREVNKEKIKEYKKQYYETTKAKIKEKMTCDCGSTFRKRDKPRHEKTNKHKNYYINLNSKVL